jgi:hypothetical protein
MLGLISLSVKDTLDLGRLVNGNRGIESQEDSFCVFEFSCVGLSVERLNIP